MDWLQANGLEHLPVFLTSLGIGLLMGLERERSPVAKAGLRTFALVALLGTLAGLLSSMTASAWVLGAGLTIVGLMMIAAYARDPADSADPGTTTVAAVMVCYALGAMVWFGHSTIAVMLGIAATLLLYFKAELRGISLNLSRPDLISILQFAVVSFVILPILPSRNYGPYQALNPYQLWLMVVLISGVSLAGYIALKLLSRRQQAVWLGLFGGLVSSTATTLVYARHGRNNAPMASLAVMVVLLANLVVLLRLGFLCAVAAPAVLPLLIPVLGGGLLLGVAGSAYWWRRLMAEKANSAEAPPVPVIANPTEFRTALGFGLLYGIVLICSAWLSAVAGSKGLYGVALVAGLTDVDAIALSSLRLFDLGRLSGAQAVTAITLAFLSNLGFKLGMVAVVGGWAMARPCAVGMTAVAAGLLAGWAWVVY